MSLREKIHIYFIDLYVLAVAVKFLRPFAFKNGCE